VAGYDWLAWLEVTVEPLPVAGFATCGLPVCVPVTLWGPTLPPLSDAAIQVVAATERQNAKPTTENDFVIENIPSREPFLLRTRDIALSCGVASPQGITR
jgi:hypothetical protein